MLSIVGSSSGAKSSSCSTTILPANCCGNSAFTLCLAGHNFDKILGCIQCNLPTITKCLANQIWFYLNFHLYNWLGYQMRPCSKVSNTGSGFWSTKIPPEPTPSVSGKSWRRKLKTWSRFFSRMKKKFPKFCFSPTELSSASDHWSIRVTRHSLIQSAEESRFAPLCITFPPFPFGEKLGYGIWREHKQVNTLFEKMENKSTLF